MKTKYVRSDLILYMLWLCREDFVNYKTKNVLYADVEN